MMKRVQTSSSTYVSAIFKAAVLFLLLLLMLVGGFQCSISNDLFDKEEEKVVSVNLIFDNVKPKKRELNKEQPKPQPVVKPPSEPEVQQEPIESDLAEIEKQNNNEQVVKATPQKETETPAEVKVEKEKPSEPKKTIPKTDFDELFAKLEEEEPKKKTVTGQMPSSVDDIVQNEVEDDGYTEEQEKIIKYYEQLIVEKVRANWRRPLNATKDMSATFSLKLFAGGAIRGLDFKEQSNAANQAYIDSIRKALEQSEPFEVPADPELFDYFRQVDFVFTSEDLSL